MVAVILATIYYVFLRGTDFNDATNLATENFRHSKSPELIRLEKDATTVVQLAKQEKERERLEKAMQREYEDENEAVGK
jgi:endonuclease V-like protein UPF0215 family